MCCCCTCSLFVRLQKKRKIFELLYVKFYLVQSGIASSSTSHCPPGCTGLQSTPAATGVYHRSPHIPDKAPGMHLNLEGFQQQKKRMSAAEIWISSEHHFAYPLRFCSRDMETSRHCPGPQYFLPQPGKTPTCCPSVLSLPPLLACLLLHVFYSAYQKAQPDPSAQIPMWVQVFCAFIFIPNSDSCNEQLPHQLISSEWKNRHAENDLWTLNKILMCFSKCIIL